MTEPRYDARRDEAALAAVQLTLRRTDETLDAIAAVPTSATKAAEQTVLALRCSILERAVEEIRAAVTPSETSEVT